MIHSLLPARDCETTTTSSSHPFPYPEPTNHDHGALKEDTTAHQEHQLNHDGRFVPTNLLKPIKEETELGSCRNPKPDHMMMMISPNQFKDDPSCRNPAKACVDCNTTKTPLWRSGPQGPKSLCNACGIRYRKARRALAALADPSKFQTSHCPKPKRPKLQQHLDPTFVSKKRTKIGYSHCSSKKKGSHHRSHQLCFHVENPHMGSDQYFPKDEEEAAVLLMALSCGLVHG